MKLGMTLGYSGGTFDNQVDLVRQAESLGFDSVWTAEAWGSDAVSPAAWLLASTTKIRVGTAIMQMSARTPAMAAGLTDHLWSVHELLHLIPIFTNSL